MKLVAGGRAPTARPLEDQERERHGRRADILFWAGQVAVAATSAAPASPPGYELLDEIGHGGMGVVYRARDTALDRDVAVKLLSERYAPDSVAAQRFLREARITGQLQHPGIPAVHQVGTLADGRPFLAMKLIKGSTLEALLKYRFDPSAERGRLLAIFEAICQAVGYAHAHRVIHRDLKPANIMVGAFGEVQVMDWGLAKVLGEETPATADALAAEETQAWTRVSPSPANSSHTQAGSLIGTPAFIPPEQAGGEIERVNERADVFGLGALLSVILTGKPPYVGETFESVRVQALRGRLDDCFARLEASGAEPELVALCKKCLAFEPADRPADAGAVAEAVAGLRAAADERARQAELERVQAEGRAAEQRRRRRILLTASGVIAVVFLLGFAGVFWQWRVAEDNLTIAEKAEKEATQQRNRADGSQRQSRRLLYAADMNLAQQALKQNNLGRARRLLDRHRPQPGEEDLRGWEWRYLWQLTRSSALATLTNRPVSGWNVSFSPDGSRLAVGWTDGHVDLWDVPGRRWIRALADREQPLAEHVAFSPVRNLLAVTSDSKEVTLYDLDSGRESVLWQAPQESSLNVRDPSFSHRPIALDVGPVGERSWSVRDLSFSRDGSRLVIYAASTGKVGDVWVVNVSSSTIESRHSTHFSGTGHFGAARLSPDNRRLYLARSDQGDERYSIQCVDLAANQEIWQTETQRDAGLAALAISSDGKVLVSGSGFSDPAIRVWDTATGRLLRQLDGHTAWVCKLVFSRDGRQLISAASDQTIRLWDTST
jgi:serine/threonine protein kinase